jgi:type IV secretory pathway ATPase VirB11/archaellum biosynthesis ATPase
MRFVMKLLGLEMAHQTAIETVQANIEEKQRRFMVSVCERFKEFIDFTAPISEDSVHDRFRLEGVSDARLSVLGLYS